MFAIRTVFFSTLISLSFSHTDCPYFEPISGGVRIPINVCLSAKIDESFWGSYKYKCDGDRVDVEWYQESNDCNLEFMTRTTSIAPKTINCPITRGNCDYLSFRAYAQRTNVCEAPKAGDYFLEFALVTGCRDSRLFDGHSEDLQCNTDSTDTAVTLSTYNVKNCDAEQPQHSLTIHSGCPSVNDSNSNIIAVPILEELEEILFNETFPINSRGHNGYIQIMECGEGYNWLWLYITAPIVFVLCCSGCLAFWCWYGRRRKRRKNTKFDSLPNEQNEEENQV